MYVYVCMYVYVYVFSILTQLFLDNKGTYDNMHILYVY